MKGLTQQLRNLKTGKRMTVTGTERSDIHKTAKRLGVPVRVEKCDEGFRVTRI